MTHDQSSRLPPSVRTLITLALPMIVSRSTQVVVGVSDAVMVADLGEGALAATTAGALNTFAVLILPMGTTFIVSSFASQLFGKGDLKGARRFGIYGLFLGLFTELLCLVSIPFIPWVLGQLPYAPDVRQLMTTYLQVRLAAGGAAIGIEALSNYYGGLGKTSYAMYANIAAMVLNVAGNYLLIKGHFGFPAMGVKGAALASAVSTTIAFAGFFVWFLRGGVATRAAGLSWREMGRMLRFGIPSGLNWFFEFSAFNVFVNVVVAGLGTTSLAALMAVMQINSVSFMPAFGIASAGAILVGQAIGAEAKQDVGRIVRMTFFTTAAWQGLVSISYLAVPELLFRPFATDPVNSQKLIQIGVHMLMLSTIWQLCDSAASTLAEALRAAGDTAFTLWARTIIAWVIFVPGSYISVRYFKLGEAAATLWLAAYLGLLAAVLFFRFRSDAWKELKLVEPDALA
ncbi:MAG: MATE family efflux transporter [Polyangiaceae bacterium]|nr:MATE family efflux transporter [Polyangiaceae bacterium]